jgi:tetratricopeptide (TPR) repeat protein
MYYSHNLHFLAVAHAMQGRYADAKKAAEQLVTHVTPHVKALPPLEVFAPTTTLILARTGRWDEILSSPAPDSGMKITKALWHFGRGLAYSAKGRPAEAKAERKAFAALAATVPADTAWGNSNARTMLKTAEGILDARLALAAGDTKASIALLREAVKSEDALRYSEPPDWYLPARERLGATLLQDGQAEEAERVFRADLKRNARNGRSLLGLSESLKAQGKQDAAELVARQFAASWKNADTPLVLADLLGLPGAPKRTPTASAKQADGR